MARRALELLYMDLWDALRAPAFDVMMLIVGVLSGALIVMAPVSSALGALSPNNFFNPVMISVAVATIYMALRSASELVDMIQGGVLQVYMAYPVSRRTVAWTLYLTRSLIPAVILIGLPALVAAIVLYPVVLRSPLDFLLMWLSYLVQSQLYGTAFLLLATRLRTSGMAIVASISFYFGYVALSFFLDLVGYLDSITVLTQVSNSMGFYYVVYDMLTSGAPAWEAAVVPSLFIGLLAAYVTYVARRFEPT
mgnify:FL=1